MAHSADIAAPNRNLNRKSKNVCMRVSKPILRRFANERCDTAGSGSCDVATMIIQ